jgi:glucodextranase-like protein
MATLQNSPEATGAPGIAPRWTHSAKDVIGTAYSTASRVWFTVSDAVISEVYFPTLDLANNFTMDHAFAAAPNGNIALTGGIDLSRSYRFTLGVGFGNTLHRAVTTLVQSLATPFGEHRERFLGQWHRICSRLHPLEKTSGDGGAPYRRSRELLLAHEDKSYAGAIIASLSIPWGEIKGERAAPSKTLRFLWRETFRCRVASNNHRRFMCRCFSRWMKEHSALQRHVDYRKRHVDYRKRHVDCRTESGSCRAAWR